MERLLAELTSANIPAEFRDKSRWHFYNGKGCPKCNQGFRGRVGIYEVLVMSEAIEELANKKEPASAIAEQAVKEGMVTMLQDGLVKALRGETTVEEVMPAAVE
jgi:type II secretory ATPase GspE/PulE/Tfp pilus assembly ATPase PilB-like protein